MKKNIVAFSAIFLVFIIGCSGPDKTNNQNSDKFIDELVEEPLDTEVMDEEKGKDVVFYNIFTPVDLNKVVDQKSSYFNSAFINTLNNITKYSTSQKIALNIGVYGADLSYLWMFEQNQQALSYLSAIQHLTSKLGIPNSFVEGTIEAAEEKSGEIDSLIVFARQAYNTTTKHLKANGRESASALILLGGWIETLNIALNMYTEPNPKLASKIITQKYSLSSLINMVQNSQDDLVMSEYLLLLKKLNDAFNAIETKLKPEDIDIDTINKRITVKESGDLNIDPSQFNQIKELTTKIREHIIN